MLELRLAVGADAEGVARVHVASWQSAYRGVLPDGFLDGLHWSHRHDFWSRELLQQGIAASYTWVLESDDGVIGFASAGPPRDDDRHSSGWWELYGIYLMPDLWGDGLGRRLMNVTLEAAPASVTQVLLWVLVGNERARRFYEQQGFLPDGCERAVEIGGERLIEVRYQGACPRLGGTRRSAGSG